mmetsp:Transcript_74850/g.199545  ORF Transcript_74850/g.199545 Transcript_74850/m.199545 type:complete len:283 (+) Transcript_74850:1655-2503(+)
MRPLRDEPRCRCVEVGNIFLKLGSACQGRLHGLDFCPRGQLDIHPTDAFFHLPNIFMDELLNTLHTSGDALPDALPLLVRQRHDTFGKDRSNGVEGLTDRPQMTMLEGWNKIESPSCTLLRDCPNSHKSICAQLAGICLQLGDSSVDHSTERLTFVEHVLDGSVNALLFRHPNQFRGLRAAENRMRHFHTIRAARKTGSTLVRHRQSFHFLHHATFLNHSPEIACLHLYHRGPLLGNAPSFSLANSWPRQLRRKTSKQRLLPQPHPGAERYVHLTRNIPTAH